jgi:hypothetical protein
MPQHGQGQKPHADAIPKGRGIDGDERAAEAAHVRRPMNPPAMNDVGKPQKNVGRPAFTSGSRTF